MASEVRGTSGLNLQVDEYSPNCPKYINRREIIYDANNAHPINKNAIREERTKLSEDDQNLFSLWTPYG